MIEEDIHLHSNFSDGKNNIEEMTLTAIKLGLKRIVPNRKFLKILKKNKVNLSYGSDSHSTKELKRYY